MDKSQLLADVHSRTSRSGIVTADRYFRDVMGCFEGGFCPVELGASDTADNWSKALKESESKLTYTNSQCRINKGSVDKNPEDGLLTFDAILTTPMRDRDGDVLLTEGAEVDMDMPLLWQHMPMSPIGKLVKVLKHDKNQLLCRWMIADTTLGRDAAKLVRIGALRMSHGFEPVEWEPMEDEQGFLFKKFKIFEGSLVSIPSNVSARVTSISKSKFHSPLVRGWLSGLKTEKACTCQKSHEPETKPAESPVPESKPEELVTKAGAKLSSETKQHITEAMMDADEICNCGDATRSILALAKSCSNHLKMCVGDEVQKDFKEHDILGSARTPSFEGTETTSWADVSKTFEAFRDGYYAHGGKKPDQSPSGVEDAPAEMLAWMASKSLLGKADGKTFADVVFFPVVNPGTNKLNAGALRAVLSGRGAQANISDAAKTSAQNKAKSLLDEHFNEGKSFNEEISIMYMAELAKANTDVLRREHRRVSLMLRHSEEQESAREWDELLSDLT